ncbi:MAG: hypothetical protein JSS14_13430 [Proteobacteria bacterium]|nr:hypothetical protein [Pseudomonadota bacterium]
MAAACLSLLASAAHAGCFGSEAFKTCTDDSGNTYNVRRFGNTTNVQGTSLDGHNWNQSSQRIGNSTFTNGTAADGSTWNSTAQRVGNTTFINGTDSRGNAFSQTCDRFGCR